MVVQFIENPNKKHVALTVNKDRITLKKSSWSGDDMLTYGAIGQKVYEAYMANQCTVTIRGTLFDDREGKVVWKNKQHFPWLDTI